MVFPLSDSAEAFYLSCCRVLDISMILDQSWVDYAEFMLFTNQQMVLFGLFI